MPLKRDKASMATAGVTPTWRAAAIAASALDRLCRPASGIWPAEALSRERENRLVRRGALGGQPAVRPIEPFELGPAARSDHPLQAGLGTVGRNATITRHDPNQMMELVSIAARSAKMSA